MLGTKPIVLPQRKHPAGLVDGAQHRGGHLPVFASQPDGSLLPAAADSRTVLDEIPQAHLLGT